VLKHRYSRKFVIICAALFCVSAKQSESRVNQFTVDGLLLAKIRKSRKISKKVKRKKSNRSKHTQAQLGGGIFNIYPPMPTIHGNFQIRKKIHVGAEAGYMSIPLEEFSGTSSYLGIDAKYFLTKKVFLGFGLGKRSFSISTKSDFNHDFGTTEITWEREIDQLTVSPRVGWYSEAKAGDAMYVSGGILLPFNSSLKSKRNVNSIEGVPDSALDEEEQSKADEVTAVTHSTKMQIEIKYLIKVK
jgi:hypothetical protein